MADLQPHVPQAIEDGLGDGLAPGGLLVGQQKQEIDVGARRQQPAAVAAGRHHRHALGFRGIVGRIEMLAGELEQRADDLVHHRAEPFGAAPAVPVVQQQPLGFGAAFGQHVPSAAAPPRCADRARGCRDFSPALRARPRSRTRRQSVVIWTWSSAMAMRLRSGAAASVSRLDGCSLRVARRLLPSRRCFRRRARQVHQKVCPHPAAVARRPCPPGRDGVRDDRLGIKNWPHTDERPI